MAKSGSEPFSHKQGLFVVLLLLLGAILALGAICYLDRQSLTRHGTSPSSSQRSDH
ncbi:MAG TPA: hypothetical protein VND66_04770 [Acidobacteriaceae bacterium]|nr:hypothetical protein [Terriglobia bacterium]HVC89920.1 hypothetical protein [Acidobacteriaceae bacterium]